MWDGSHWGHYDARDGLAWDDCNLNAFAEEADGTVWIGTSGGLSRFKPRRYRTPEAPPEVVFTKLFMGLTDVSGQRNPSLAIRSSSLIARYAAPNAPRQNGIVFRYRLEGANSALLILCAACRGPALTWLRPGRRDQRPLRQLIPYGVRSVDGFVRARVAAPHSVSVF
jgi:hypothetical protein